MLCPSQLGPPAIAPRHAMLHALSGRSMGQHHVSTFYPPVQERLVGDGPDDPDVDLAAVLVPHGAGHLVSQRPVRLVGLVQNELGSHEVRRAEASD